MTNRREFLQIGLTATALPLAASAAGATGAQERVPLYKVIYDTRFGESVAFAERARATGLVVAAISGDMTRFWYEDLYHRWREQPVAIAGLTAHGPMFCFEQLARDQGMRTVYRAEHRLDAGRGVSHRVTGPLPMLQASTGLPDRAHWGACMVEAITECPRGRAEIADWSAHSAGPAAFEVSDTESLYTWVIAPAVKAS